jgi:SAM-dependent methyltransferase
MDVETFNWLLTDAGQALLAEAQAGDLSEPARLRELTRLRRLAPPERATAAYEIAQLRARATTKFSLAGRLYFTHEALEQASGELVAAHRAERYRPYSTIADLCCGAGADTLALARIATVVAVDRDPLRLAMGAANARACGLADRASFIQADLEQAAPPYAEAIFFDPARRSGGRRIFALEAYQPPVSLVRSWRARTPAIGVKVAPGVGDDDLAALEVDEVEFISVDGELKEAALWFGPLASPGRRATILTNDQRPTTNDQRPFAATQGRRTTTEYEDRIPHPPSPIPHPPAAFSILNAQFSIQAPLALPAAYLYEPDPAILRARLVATVAEQLGAAQLDREIAYLTADRAVATPFARCWRVLEWLPFNLKRLRARLRALDAGAVTVKKRGSPLDVDALARQLSGGGARPLVVVLTQAQGKPVALICEGPVREARTEN